MSLLRRFFPSKQQREIAEQAREMIEAAVRKSREPMGCAAAAAFGAETLLPDWGRLGCAKAGICSAICPFLHLR